MQGIARSLNAYLQVWHPVRECRPGARDRNGRDIVIVNDTLPETQTASRNSGQALWNQSMSSIILTQTQRPVQSV